MTGRPLVSAPSIAAAIMLTTAVAECAGNDGGGPSATLAAGAASRAAQEPGYWGLYSEGLKGG